MNAVTDLHEFLEPGIRSISEDGRLVAPIANDEITSAGQIFVVDLEMSGPRAQVHEILDIGGVIATLEAGFPETQSWGSRIRPQRIGNADRGALKVVGYRASEWKRAPAMDRVVNELVQLGSGTLIAGWGIEMDIAFLRHTFAYLEIDWPFQPVVVDIQHIARRELNGTKMVDRFNLGHVADRLGIGRMGEHNALADAYATYDVLVALWNRRNNSPASG